MSVSNSNDRIVMLTVRDEFHLPNKGSISIVATFERTHGRLVAMQMASYLTPTENGLPLEGQRARVEIPDTGTNKAVPKVIEARREECAEYPGVKHFVTTTEEPLICFEFRLVSNDRPIWVVQMALPDDVRTPQQAPRGWIVQQIGHQTASSTLCVSLESN